MKNTKKMIALVLALLMVFCSFGTVFAADQPLLISPAPAAAPSDVTGTVYETAVTELIKAGVLSGYPDGTYKPEKAINRAESSKVVSLLAGATEEQLAADSAKSFADLDQVSWAADYIGFASSKNIINGYPDGTFRGLNAVTYNEMGKMLVAAAGIDASALTGNWPDNYMDKAKELGILNGLTIADGNKAANRGDVALMAYNFTQIGKAPAEKPEVKPEPKPEDKPLTGVEEFINKHYSAVLFGVIQGTVGMENKDGEGVSGVTFLMGSYGQADLGAETGSAAETTIKGMAADDYLEGQVFALRAYNGEITNIEGPGASYTDHFAELTAIASIDKETGSNFAKVASWEKDRNVVIFENASKHNEAIGLSDNCVVYELVKDASDEYYEVSSLSALKKNALVRIYDATDNDVADGDIIIVDVRK